MDKIDTSEQINNNRRNFFGAAAATIAAAQFRIIGRAEAQPGKSKLPSIKPGTTKSFAPLQQIDAGVLNVGYAEAGAASGHPIVLLHGWPYDIHSYVDVAPLLASAGYRVIVPYLRGYGSTRFLSDETPRNGEQALLWTLEQALGEGLTPAAREAWSVCSDELAGEMKEAAGV